MSAKLTSLQYRMPKSFQMKVLPGNFRSGLCKDGLRTFPVRLFQSNAVFEVDRIKEWVDDPSDFVYLYTTRLLQCIEELTESRPISTENWSAEMFSSFCDKMRMGVEHIELHAACMPRQCYLDEGR